MSPSTSTAGVANVRREGHLFVVIVFVEGIGECESTTVC